MQPTNDTRTINPNPSTTSNPSHPFFLESLSKEVISSGTNASLNSAQDVSESRDNVEELKGHVHAKVINKGSPGGTVQGVCSSLCEHSEFHDLDVIKLVQFNCRSWKQTRFKF